MILMLRLKAEVKSLWSKYIGLHTCYNGNNKKMQKCKFQLIFKYKSQFGLSSATRGYEAGITSNRISARYGEFGTWSCTHRPSRHGSRFCIKYLKDFENNKRKINLIYIFFIILKRMSEYRYKMGNWGEVVTRQPQGNLWLD